VRRLLAFLVVLGCSESTQPKPIPAFTARFCVDSLVYDHHVQDSTGVQWSLTSNGKVTGRWCLDFSMVDSSDTSGSVVGGGVDTVRATARYQVPPSGLDTIVSAWLLLPATVEGTFVVNGDGVTFSWNDRAAAQWLAGAWFPQQHVLRRPWYGFLNLWRYGPDLNGAQLYADIIWRRE
jgi:hypothetical protein